MEKLSVLEADEGYQSSAPSIPLQEPISSKGPESTAVGESSSATQTWYRNPQKRVSSHMGTGTGDADNLATSLAKRTTLTAIPEIETDFAPRSSLARKQNKSSASRARAPQNAQNNPSSKTKLRGIYEEQKRVQAAIFDHSLLALVDRPKEATLGEIFSRILNLQNQPDFQTMISSLSADNDGHDLDQSQIDSIIFAKSQSAFLIWFLCEFWTCRNIAILVYANCARLQAADIAGAFISALVYSGLPWGTKRRVVSLRRVQIDQVRNLAKTLVACSTALLVPVAPSPDELKDHFLSIQAHCKAIMDGLELWGIVQDLNEQGLQHTLEHALSVPRQKEVDYFSGVFSSWRCTLEALDFCVLAYEGAHVSSFDAQILGTEMDIFFLPEPSLFFVPAAQTRAQESLCVVFRRLNLECLAPFLGDRGVWVLGRGLAEAQPAFYVRADIETFADVWGPVWAVTKKIRPEHIIRYNVGGGAIVPWPYDEDQHPLLQAGERLCHWENNARYIQHDSSQSPDTGNSTLFLELTHCIHTCYESNGHTGSSLGNSENEDMQEIDHHVESLSGHEILIIGASHKPRLKWQRCRCPTDTFKQHLRNAGRLEPIIASKAFRYVDSQQSSFAVSSHGIQAGLARTVKVQKMQSLKTSVLEMWENDIESRHPRIFENLWGVALSLCTMNAKRVPIVDMLGEDSVLALLRQFKWSDVGENALEGHYLEAIKCDDRRALGDLWEDHPAWQKELGNALLICLRILFRTGYDENRDEFHALWLPRGWHLPRRVTLKPDDQSWVRMLKDTTYSFTVAVVVEDSLRERDSTCSGHRAAPKPQWFQSPSVLQTAISINNSLEPISKLRMEPTHRRKEQAASQEEHPLQRWKYRWNVSGIEMGDRFWMSSQARLRSICSLNKWWLLLEVDTVKRLLIREIFGMKPLEQIGHYEYTDNELESENIEPIPIHITS